MPERAENAPLATHSDDLKGGVHDPVFLDPFGFKEVGPFLSHFYNTWSPKPLPLESVPHNHFGPTDASEGRNRHQEQHWCEEDRAGHWLREGASSNSQGGMPISLCATSFLIARTWVESRSPIWNRPAFAPRMSVSRCPSETTSYIIF